MVRCERLVLSQLFSKSFARKHLRTVNFRIFLKVVRKKNTPTGDGPVIARKEGKGLKVNCGLSAHLGRFVCVLLHGSHLYVEKATSPLSRALVGVENRGCKGQVWGFFLD